MMSIDLKSCYLGMEFGSTRIKAVLISSNYIPLASGAYTWSDHLDGGYWSYTMEDVKKGLRSCYAKLKKEVKDKYGFACKAGSHFLHVLFQLSFVCHDL